MRGLIGGAKPALKRGVEIVVADMVGEALSRAATKFGGSKVLAMAKVPTQYIGPGMRILVGLFGGKLLRMLPVRQVRSPAFLSTFSAVNVAFGLMALTGGIRAKAFSAVGLSDYDIDDAYGGSIGPSYMGDWETASDGVGDWETASDGVGGYELAAVAPPAGILGTPPHGVLDYDSGGY